MKEERENKSKVVKSIEIRDAYSDLQNKDGEFRLKTVSCDSKTCCGCVFCCGKFNKLGTM